MFVTVVMKGTAMLGHAQAVEGAEGGCMIVSGVTSGGKAWA